MGRSRAQAIAAAQPSAAADGAHGAPRLSFGVESSGAQGLWATATISLRLPAWMLDDLKVLANKRDVSYQSLLKVFLAERIERELRKER